jgi:hypothetical protein
LQSLVAETGHVGGGSKSKAAGCFLSRVDAVTAIAYGREDANVL